LILPRGFRAAVHGGSLNLSRALPPDPLYPPGLYAFPNSGAWWLIPSVEWRATIVGGKRTSRTDIILPLWVVSMASAAVGVIGARRCRPPRVGLCDSCDYDLRGTPRAERCPECGAALEPVP
jgi:hypothetical protein